MVKAGWFEVGVAKGGEGDASDELAPLKTDLQQTVEGSWGAEVFDEGEDVLRALFEAVVTPAHAAKPRRSKDNDSFSHFSVEATLGQRRVDGMRLDLFALFFQERGGTKGVVHLSKPDGEESGRRFEVRDRDREDASGTGVAPLFHFGCLGHLVP
jgi:hypothetical protein